jgi:hypothetical protein
MAIKSRGLTVAGVPTTPNPTVPFANLQNSIGNPALNRVRQTAEMAKQAATAPRAPGLAKGGIRKIRVRRQRFRYAPAAPAGGFALGQPQY